MTQSGGVWGPGFSGDSVRKAGRAHSNLGSRALEAVLPTAPCSLPGQMQRWCWPMMRGERAALAQGMLDEGPSSPAAPLSGGVLAGLSPACARRLRALAATACLAAAC